MSDFALFYRGREHFESPSEGQKHFEKWVDWFESLRTKGVLKNQGHPLEGTGKVLRGSAKTINDGPFSEAKDVIGGFSIVEAGSLEEAASFASGCPILEVGGSVEVRPIQTLRM